jgi:hypothetical protein
MTVSERQKKTVRCSTKRLRHWAPEGAVNPAAPALTAALTARRQRPIVSQVTRSGQPVREAALHTL